MREPKTVPVRIGRNRPPVRKVSRCPYCAGKPGGKVPYSKRKHPINKDCAGTGTETVWR